VLLLRSLRDDGLALWPLLLLSPLIVDDIVCSKARILIQLILEFCLVLLRNGLIPPNYLEVVLLFEAIVESHEDPLVILLTLGKRLLNSRFCGLIYC
jgi:hypothetical protein